MAKQSERRGKLFGVLNLLDLLILLFIVALAAVLLLRSNLTDTLGGTAEDISISYSVRVEPVRVMSMLAVSKGDPLFDEETGVQIGVVSKVDASPYMREVTLSNGTIVTSPDPEYYTLIIWADGSGKNSEYGPMINGSRICTPGATIKLGSTRLTTTGRFDTVEIKS